MEAAWRLLVLCVMIGLGEYVAVRAWALSFTHDESVSYLADVRDPLLSVFLPSGETGANNHPLNTLAMKLAVDVLGSSEISLRWASLAAFVVYVAALVVLLGLVERLSLRVLGIALAVGSPYVLDFFSLARGYGLALALMAVSALFTLLFVERPSTARAVLAVVTAGAAVLANLATVDYYPGVVLVLVLAVVLPAGTGERPVSLRRLGAVLVLPTVGVALLAGLPLERLRSEGELYFGGDTGFWQDTVHSLASNTLYHQGPAMLTWTLVVLVATAVVAGGVAAATAARRRSSPLHAAACVLLVVPGLASIVQHHLVGSLFFVERTALFFVPLFAIWLALAADALARDPRFTRGVVAAAAAIVAVACVNLAAAANLSYVLDWRFDATTERVISQLAGSQSDPPTTEVGVSYLFQPTTSFYRETRFRWLRECPTDCLTPRAEYYYVTGPDLATVRQRGARVLRVYSLSGGVLARAARPD